MSVTSDKNSVQLRRCAVADCIWSENGNFCEILHNASVPLDDKWPLTVLQLRGVKNNSLLTDDQKSSMQELLLTLLQQGDFSSKKYAEIKKAEYDIITRSLEQKLAEAGKEARELTKEMTLVLGSHAKQVNTVTQEVDASIASGQEPASILTDLRASLKVMAEKLEEDTRMLKNLSNRDSLTGLANRRNFDDFLDESVEQWRQDKTAVSMLIFDIDHFKNFNDTYGHLVGDHILRALASKVQKILKPLLNEDSPQALLARYGGEEFAVILRGDATAQDLDLTERIRNAIENTLLVLRDADNRIIKDDLRVTVSVGVARVLPGWKDGIHTKLIEGADKALYHAKHSGRNCSAFYTPEATPPFRLLTRK